ncbi:MAG: hypothetical protein JSR45_05210 [Proteobacteria bacterium]|nr:hypothetical protein [Pseudomonadota bacterium]
MIYALCVAFFVLGFVARDAVKAIWSLKSLQRMNRRFKRGGVNSAGPGPSRVVPIVRATPMKSGAEADSGPSARAVGLFGPADGETAEVRDEAPPAA